MGVVPLSEPVMRAFIAVAEHVEDPFRPICILTLTEIRMRVTLFSNYWYLTIFLVLIDIDLVARTGGTRFLLHALGEGPVELIPILSAAFLHIVDSPRTRSYFTVGTDLEVIIFITMFLTSTLTCQRRLHCLPSPMPMAKAPIMPSG